MTIMTLHEQAALVALLERRYGDGTVYLRGGDDRQLLNKAISLGLVSRDGYLTAAGQRFVQNGSLGEPSPRPEPGSPEHYELLDDGIF